MLVTRQRVQPVQAGEPVLIEHARRAVQLVLVFTGIALSVVEIILPDRRPGVYAFGLVPDCLPGCCPKWVIRRWRVRS